MDINKRHSSSARSWAPLPWPTWHFLPLYELMQEGEEKEPSKGLGGFHCQGCPHLCQSFQPRKCPLWSSPVPLQHHGPFSLERRQSRFFLRSVKRSIREAVKSCEDHPHHLETSGQNRYNSTKHQKYKNAAKRCSCTDPSPNLKREKGK